MSYLSLAIFQTSPSSLTSDNPVSSLTNGAASTKAKQMLGPGSTPTSFKIQIKRNPSTTSSPVRPQPVLQLSSQTNGAPISPTKQLAIRRETSELSELPELTSATSSIVVGKPYAGPNGTNGAAMDSLTLEEIEQLRSVRQLMLMKGSEKMMDFLRQS